MDDLDYGCELYTTAGAEYKAIKDSLHIDYDALWKEAEEIQSIDTLEVNDLKVKDQKRTEKHGGRKKVTKSSENVTPEEAPVTLEVPNDCVTERSRRRDRAIKRGVETNALESQPKQKHVIGPTIVIDSPGAPEIVDGHISLSSDSETELNMSVPEEDDNYEMSVKVWWKFERFDKFTIRRYQKIALLFDHYSQLENVAQSQVLLTLNDVQVHPYDTPDSLKLTVASVLEGGVTTCEDLKCVSNQVKRALSVDEIELKLQRKGHKEPVLIRINKTQKMRVLMLKCAECLELPAEKLKFSFDGESLNPNDTPVDLDLEGGECIDLHVYD